MTSTDQLPSAIQKPAGTGLATAALIVGISAFVAGWVAVLGGLISVAGIILGIVAVRTRRAPARSIVGLSLSSLAFVFNLILSAVVIVGFLAGGGVTGALKAVESAAVPTTTLVTPCYTFDAPAAYINNQSDLATAACITTEQLWGEFNADGTVNNTGVGSILGSVSVDPVSTKQSDEVNPDGSLEGMVEYLGVDFIPAMGTVIGEAESLTVDGLPASLTRVVSTNPDTKTKALLVLRAPEVYQLPDEDVRFFVVSFVTPEDNGDAIIDAAIASWTWK